MKKLFVTTALLSLFSLMILSCKKKDDPKPDAPQDPNEAELITSVKLILTESVSGNETSFEFLDVDGQGGINPTKQTIVLSANKTYSGKIVLTDKTKIPFVSISDEVSKEKEEHQFFYTVSDADLTVSYTDFDANGVPVGLRPSFVTGNIGSGTLKVVLKHQPGIKPLSGLGDVTKGETDVEVTFDVIIN